MPVRFYKTNLFNRINIAYPVQEVFKTLFYYLYNYFVRVYFNYFAVFVPEPFIKTGLAG